MGCTILLLALINLKQKKEVWLPTSVSMWLVNNYGKDLGGKASQSPVSTVNHLRNWQAALPFSVRNQLTESSWGPHQANLLLIFREGWEFPRRKHFYSRVCFWNKKEPGCCSLTGWVIFASSFPGPFIAGRTQLLLQLAINEAQALALGFHKVLLGQQSHQLGCLKFYHQHSSNKCWPKDFWSSATPAA